MAGPGKGRRGASPKDVYKSLTSGSMVRIIKLVLKHYWIHLIFVLIGIILAAIASVKGTLFTQTLIDSYIIPLIGKDNPDYSPLLSAISKVAVIYIIGAASAFAYNLIMVRVGQGSLRIIRKQLFEKMEKLPIKYFDTHPFGDVMSIYTNDTDTLREFIGRSFPEIVNLLATLISTLISMFVLSVPLTVISLILVSFVVLITVKVSSLSGRYFGEQQKQLGVVNGYIEEMMSGQKVIKVFTHEQQTINDMQQHNEDLRKVSNNAHGIANILMPATAQLGNLNYVIVAVIGAIFAINGRFGMTIGTLVSFMTLNKGFNRPFAMMSMQLNSIVMAAAGAERVYSLMDEEPEVDNGIVVLKAVEEDENGNLKISNRFTGQWGWILPDRIVKLEGDIVFDDVDFGYRPDHQILYNIYMFANKGQKIAFVGSTGAGKTTITNLINRFYDIQDGKIRYDGININNIKKASLRNSLGIVLQDTHLFTGTITDNIRYGWLGASDEDCIKAAKLANAHGFISRMPDGYNTFITGDGSNLSQGQRQLIAIARAAVSNPPVLILDEATSSIDTRTEQLVQKGMDSLMKGRTTFVIAHRLSTVQNADCIMVLEKGHIIERGSHEELLEQKGRYYQLYTGNAVS
ncbi:MAG: ABC transporter ATP-binding protein [Lachnospiraceae bacterium]|nr:ABC transporter ATP-binding protein [Candidatus Darwinimomas equi]